MEWWKSKPQKEWNDPEKANTWPGLIVEGEDYSYVSSDCFVVDLSFSTPAGKPLGSASVMFNALAW